MQKEMRKKDDISFYIEDREYIANTYVLKCFGVSMLLYFFAFILNILGIFVVNQDVMRQGFVPALVMYLAVWVASKKISLSNEKTKYFLLFSIILVYTIMGVSITYHVVLISILPFVYATLYSSGKVMKYVYVLTVFSTIIIVYGGYFFGLCDANMVLLTTNRVQEYVVDGRFILSGINENPYFNLMLFFIIPRCLIYIAFMFVCNSIFNIVSGSLEKARLTDELERAKSEAEAANRAKSLFLARMSHEIRTPVNAVLGMNEMILRESNEETVKNYAQDVKNSSLTLLNIINEILDSTKIESGMMEIVEGNYEIGVLLNDLYHMINIRAKEKDLALIFDIDSAIPKEYYGDDKRIRQILINLLTNAVKYTNQGSVTLTVRCSAEEDRAVLYFAVKDTGIGIKEEDIGKITEAFHRVDVLRNRNVEGTGLGMNIVQQFLKLMNSELQIRSEYEKGSEFSFELVQKIVNSEPLGEFKEKFLQAVTKNEYRSGYAAPEAKVLVVDDYKINLKVFKGLLKQTQMQVYGAAGGKECLEKLKEQKFDLIFLDHMMPDMDGVETLHVMREKKLGEGIPVIMLTANAIVGDREKYLDEGFDGFLSKPIMSNELDEIILKYIPAEKIVLEK